MRTESFLRQAKPVLITLFLLSALFTASCVKERIIRDNTQGKDPKPDEVKVKMLVAVPDMDILGTRAGVDDIVQISVMTFDNAGNMTDAPQKATIVPGALPTDPDRYYVATLKFTTAWRRVVIIANADDELEAYKNNASAGFPGGAWRVDGVGGVTATDATKLDHLTANLKSLPLEVKSLNGTNYIVEQPDNDPPMTGEVVLTGGIGATSVISNGGSPIQLRRAVAKYTVEVDASITPSTFKILGASLGNAPLEGYILPSTSPLHPAMSPVYHYANPASTNETTSYITLVGPDGATNNSLPLYCYEDKASNELFVILKAEYNGVAGYYRINIVSGTLADDPATRVQFDANRNTWYTIKVKKAGIKGYSTIAEAINNKASNLEYVVTAYVPTTNVIDDATDITSNGAYFLGVSNSTFVAYVGPENSGPIVAASLTHDAPATVTTATISVSADISLVNLPGIYTSFSPNSATFNPGVSKRFNIEVEIGQLNYTTGGTITINLGNLTKVITVKRKDKLALTRTVLDEYATADYISGILSGGPNGWLSFTDTPEGLTHVKELILTNTATQKLYIVHNGNVALTNAVPRNATVYIGRKDNQGRTRLYFEQPALNYNETIEKQISVNSYVGAFWKADQTGERLIRIPRLTTGSADGEWIAAVMYGEEWILLDRVMTNDPNVGWRGGTEALVADMNIATNDQMHRVTITGDPIVTSGTLRASGSPGFVAGDDFIYFRIGLRSNHSSSELYPARYGVVALFYKDNTDPVNKTKVQRIFIRQGHDPDFLMRETDPINSGGLTSRNAAVKFSPYNLTAAGIAGMTTLSPVRNVQVAPYGGKLTDYPTQAGAFWQWAHDNSSPLIRNAWAPFNNIATNWSITNTTTSYWDALTATNETCPPGYRRPKDGRTDIADSGPDMLQSELRQSLWLSPTTGFGSTMTSGNFTHGFYADGFFDRRSIVSSEVNNVASSTVAVGTPNVAYRGLLFYNPNNNASLFFPAAGTRSGSVTPPDGGAQEWGNRPVYWTSSSSNTTTAIAINGAVSGMGAGIFNTNSPQRVGGTSIRCVYNCVAVKNLLVKFVTQPTATEVSIPFGTTTQLEIVRDAATEPITFQWQRSFDDGGTWYDVDGANGETLNAKAVVVGTTRYRVIVTNCGIVQVSANLIEVKGTGVEPRPDIPLYVGAFWKNDQMGERLINIPRPSVSTLQAQYDGAWSARVISGNFIMIDDDITTNINDDMLTSDALHLLPPGSSTFVCGFADASNPIYFRIGLINTLPAKAAPRYGVVLLTYNNHERSQRIFIRQGHEADYLMRPSDQISGSVRQNTRMMSPYNLTTTGMKSNPILESDQILNTPTPRVNAAFTDYPSQAGAFFQWAYDATQTNYHRRAFNAWNNVVPSSPPIITNTVGSGVYWSTLSANNESCPPGYRRPNDGSTTAAVASPAFATSEIRSSLWLNAGSVSTTPTDPNSVWGYYADGWFDRQTIGNAPSNSGINNGVANSAVSTGNNNIAYQGRLFFNPNNHASLFFPAPASRTNTGVFFSTPRPGEWVQSWTSSNDGTISNFIWSLFFNSSSARLNPTAPSQANSIRCVWDVDNPISYVTITPVEANLTTWTATQLLTATTSTYNGLAASGTLSYLWERSVDGGENWFPVATTTTNTYTCDGAVIVGETLYRVTVTQGTGSTAREIMSENTSAITGPKVDRDPPTNFNVYVGAFWRNDQTGERLIRISRGAATAAEIDGAWAATVIEGLEWIMLDKNPSGGGAFPPTTPPGINGVEALQYQLDPNFAYNIVKGTLRATTAPGYQTGDEFIYFRIGLKDVNSTPEPRYGMVQLTYNGHARAQRIFIRQGEAADYIMMPYDQYGTPAVSRPLARQWPPFNLTAPSLKGTTTNSVQIPQQGTPVADYFTDYPSQAGAMFQMAHTSAGTANQRMAWNSWQAAAPTGYGTTNIASGATYWNTLGAFNEGCPAGYHRPIDGSITAHVTAANAIPANSEMRQSLYSNPQSGITSNVDNSVWGYYADGWFDRQNITNSTGAAGTTTVSAGNNDIAHIGRLYFNPETHNSLFLPAAGYRITAGTLADVGTNGYYWSTTTYSGTYAWHIRLSRTTANQDWNAAGGTRSAMADAIRCVMDVTP